MSDIQLRAAEAQALQDFDAFKAVSNDIEKDAVTAFLDPLATTAGIEAAHEKVRAVNVFRAAIQARIDAATFEKRKKDKDQHRG